MTIFETGEDREVKFVDYVAVLIYAVAAFVKGVWTGVKQIPTYVGSTYRSQKHDIIREQKRRVDGKTPSQRRIDAIRPGSPSTQSQDD